MTIIKNINLFNGLLALFIFLNIISYATGRLQLIPVLVIGALQLLLGAFVHIAWYKLKNVEEDE